MYEYIKACVAWRLSECSAQVRFFMLCMYVCMAPVGMLGPGAIFVSYAVCVCMCVCVCLCVRLRVCEYVVFRMCSSDGCILCACVHAHAHTYTHVYMDRRMLTLIHVMIHTRVAECMHTGANKQNTHTQTLLAIS
jgi:hypothetical protein